MPKRKRKAKSAAPAEVSRLTDDEVRKTVTLLYEVKDVSTRSFRMHSPTHILRGLPWCIEVDLRPGAKGVPRVVGLFAICNNHGNNRPWSCEATVTLRLLARNKSVANTESKYTQTFFGGASNGELINDWGYPSFVEWDKFTNPAEGWVANDTAVFEAVITAEKPIFDPDTVERIAENYAEEERRKKEKAAAKKTEATSTASEEPDDTTQSESATSESESDVLSSSDEDCEGGTFDLGSPTEALAFFEKAVIDPDNFIAAYQFSTFCLLSEMAFGIGQPVNLISLRTKSILRSRLGSGLCLRRALGDCGRKYDLPATCDLLTEAKREKRPDAYPSNRDLENLWSEILNLAFRLAESRNYLRVFLQGSDEPMAALALTQLVRSHSDDRVFEKVTLSMVWDLIRFCNVFPAFDFRKTVVEKTGSTNACDFLKRINDLAAIDFTAKPTAAPWRYQYYGNRGIALAPKYQKPFCFCAEPECGGKCHVNTWAKLDRLAAAVKDRELTAYLDCRRCDLCCILGLDKRPDDLFQGELGFRGNKFRYSAVTRSKGQNLPSVLEGHISFLERLRVLRGMGHAKSTVLTPVPALANYPQDEVEPLPQLPPGMGRKRKAKMVTQATQTVPETEPGDHATEKASELSSEAGDPADTETKLITSDVHGKGESSSIKDGEGEGSLPTTEPPKSFNEIVDVAMAKINAKVTVGDAAPREESEAKTVEQVLVDRGITTGSTGLGVTSAALLQGNLDDAADPARTDPTRHVPDNCSGLTPGADMLSSADTEAMNTEFVASTTSGAKIAETEDARNTGTKLIPGAETAKPGAADTQESTCALSTPGSGENVQPASTPSAVDRIALPEPEPKYPEGSSVDLPLAPMRDTDLGDGRFGSFVRFVAATAASNDFAEEAAPTSAMSRPLGTVECRQEHDSGSSYTTATDRFASESGDGPMSERTLVIDGAASPVNDAVEAPSGMCSVANSSVDSVADLASGAVIDEGKETSQNEAFETLSTNDACDPVICCAMHKSQRFSAINAGGDETTSATAQPSTPDREPKAALAARTAVDSESPSVHIQEYADFFESSSENPVKFIASFKLASFCLVSEWLGWPEPVALVSERSKRLLRSEMASRITQEQKPGRVLSKLLSEGAKVNRPSSTSNAAVENVFTALEGICMELGVIRWFARVYSKLDRLDLTKDMSPSVIKGGLSVLFPVQIHRCGHVGFAQNLIISLIYDIIIFESYPECNFTKVVALIVGPPQTRSERCSQLEHFDIGAEPKYPWSYQFYGNRCIALSKRYRKPISKIYADRIEKQVETVLDRDMLAYVDCRRCDICCILGNDEWSADLFPGEIGLHEERSIFEILRELYYTHFHDDFLKGVEQIPPDPVDGPGLSGSIVDVLSPPNFDFDDADFPELPALSIVFGPAPEPEKRSAKSKRKKAKKAEKQKQEAVPPKSTSGLAAEDLSLLTSVSCPKTMLTKETDQSNVVLADGDAKPVLGVTCDEKPVSEVICCQKPVSSEDENAKPVLGVTSDEKRVSEVSCDEKPVSSRGEDENAKPMVDMESGASPRFEPKPVTSDQGSERSENPVPSRAGTDAMSSDPGLTPVVQESVSDADHAEISASDVKRPAVRLKVSKTKQAAKKQRQEKKKARKMAKKSQFHKSDMELRATSAVAALKSGHPKDAAELFRQLIDMVEFQDCDLHFTAATRICLAEAVVRHENSTAAELTEAWQSICAAIDSLGDDFVFPGALYLKVRISIRQFKYDQARYPLSVLQKILENRVQFEALRYPYTIIDIPATTRSFLETEISGLWEKIRNPERPDHMCRFENCPDPQIYFSYNFNGVRLVYCVSGCMAAFHPVCSDEALSNLGVLEPHNPKEIRTRDIPCTTPDYTTVTKSIVKPKPKKPQDQGHVKARAKRHSERPPTWARGNDRPKVAPKKQPEPDLEDATGDTGLEGACRAQKPNLDSGLASDPTTACSSALATSADATCENQSREPERNSQKSENSELAQPGIAKAKTPLGTEDPLSHTENLAPIKREKFLVSDFNPNQKMKHKRVRPGKQENTIVIGPSRYFDPERHREKPKSQKPKEAPWQMENPLLTPVVERFLDAIHEKLRSTPDTRISYDDTDLMRKIENVPELGDAFETAGSIQNMLKLQKGRFECGEFSFALGQGGVSSFPAIGEAAAIPTKSDEANHVEVPRGPVAPEWAEPSPTNEIPGHRERSPVIGSNLTVPSPSTNELQEREEDPVAPETPKFTVRRVNSALPQASPRQIAAPRGAESVVSDVQLFDRADTDTLRASPGLAEPTVAPAPAKAGTVISAVPPALTAFPPTPPSGAEIRNQGLQAEADGLTPTAEVGTPCRSGSNTSSLCKVDDRCSTPSSTGAVPAVIQRSRDLAAKLGLKVMRTPTKSDQSGPHESLVHPDALNYDGDIAEPIEQSHPLENDDSVISGGGSGLESQRATPDSEYFTALEESNSTLATTPLPVETPESDLREDSPTPISVNDSIVFGLTRERYWGHLNNEKNGEALVRALYQECIDERCINPFACPAEELAQILIDYIWEQQPPSTCAVCVMPLGRRPSRVEGCGHQFHETCFIEWLDDFCPVCNADISLM